MEELRILKCMSKSAIKALGKPEIKCFPMEAEVKKKLRLEKEPI
jgi:hypothetical protein